MEDGNIVNEYRAMSPVDQKTFQRWIATNMIAGAVLLGLLVSAAIFGGQSDTNAVAARGPVQHAEAK
jgi:hypothetical protein